MPWAAVWAQFVSGERGSSRRSELPGLKLASGAVVSFMEDNSNLDEADVVEVRVPPRGVVEAIDVLGDGRVGRPTGGRALRASRTVC